MLEDPEQQERLNSEVGSELVELTTNGSGEKDALEVMEGMNHDITDETFENAKAALLQEIVDETAEEERLAELTKQNKERKKAALEAKKKCEEAKKKCEEAKKRKKVGKLL